MKTRQAFTLIEVLAAMAVLSIVVLLTGNLFSQASSAWVSGERKIIQQDLGRSTVDLIQSDLYAAVADKVVPFAQHHDVVYEVSGAERSSGTVSSGIIGTNDALYFISGVGGRPTDTTQRDMHEVAYYVQLDAEGKGVLRRHQAGIVSGGLHKDGAQQFQDFVSTKPNMPSTYAGIMSLAMWGKSKGSGIVMNNVYSFEIDCVDQTDTLVDDYYSKTHDPFFAPKVIDVRFTVLSDDQWATANDRSDWHAYAMQHGATFTFTTYIPSRGR